MTNHIRTEARDRLVFPVDTFVTFDDVMGRTHRVIVPAHARPTDGGTPHVSVVPAREILPGMAGSQPIALGTCNDAGQCASLSDVMAVRGSMTGSGGEVMVAIIRSTFTGVTADETYQRARRATRDVESAVLADVRLTAAQWLILKERVPDLYDLLCDAESGA